MGNCFGDQKNKIVYWFNHQFKSKNMLFFTKKFWKQFKQQEFQMVQILNANKKTLNRINITKYNLIFIITSGKMKPQVSQYIQNVFPDKRKFIHLLIFCQDFQQSAQIKAQPVIQNCSVVTPKFDIIIQTIKKLIQADKQQLKKRYLKKLMPTEFRNSNVQRNLITQKSTNSKILQDKIQFLMGSRQNKNKLKTKQVYNPFQINVINNMTFRKAGIYFLMNYRNKYIFFQRKQPQYIFQYSQGKEINDVKKIKQSMKILVEKLNLQISLENNFNDFKKLMLENLQELNSNIIQLHTQKTAFTITNQYIKYIKQQKTIQQMCRACNITNNFFKTSSFVFINYLFVYILDNKIDQLIQLAKPFIIPMIFNYFHQYGTFTKIKKVYKYMNYQDNLKLTEGNILMVSHFFECTLQRKKGKYTIFIIDLEDQDNQYITFYPYCQLQKGKIVLIPYSKLKIYYIKSSKEYHEVYCSLLGDENLIRHMYECHIDKQFNNLERFNFQINVHKKYLSIHQKSLNIVNEACSNYSLGLLYGKIKKYNEARDSFEKYIELLQKEGRNQQEIFTQQLIQNLVGIYIESRQPQKASVLAQKLIAIIKQKYGENSIKMIQLKKMLGVIYSNFSKNQPGQSYKSQFIKNQNQALQYSKEALQQLQKQGKKNKLILDDPLHNQLYYDIGLQYQRMDKFQESLKNYQYSLGISNKNQNIGGDKTAQKAKILKSIAAIYEKIGSKQNNNKQMFKKSIEYYERAQLVCVEVFGFQHNQTLIIYDSIGQLYKKMNQYQKFIQYKHKRLRKKQKQNIQ